MMVIRRCEIGPRHKGWRSLMVVMVVVVVDVIVIVMGRKERCVGRICMCV